MRRVLPQSALPEAEKKRQVAHHLAFKRDLSERFLQRRNKRGETFVDRLIHAKDMAKGIAVTATDRINLQRNAAIRNQLTSMLRPRLERRPSLQRGLAWQ